eukprot:jgi/Chlat1/3784/Chrsp259S03919
MAQTLAQFFAAVGINVAVFLVIVLAFMGLRRWKSTSYIYLKRPDHDETCSHSWFGWIRCSMKPTEADILQRDGLDTVMYMRLFSFALRLFIGCSLYCLPVLLPINATGNFSAGEAKSALEQFTMSNIPPKSSKLWAHCLGTWLVSLYTFVLLYQYYRDFTELRNSFLASADTRAQEHTIIVTDIPPRPITNQQRAVEGAREFFGRLYPRDFVAHRGVVDMRSVESAYARREALLKKLDRAEAILAAQVAESAQLPEDGGSARQSSAYTRFEIEHPVTSTPPRQPRKKSYQVGHNDDDNQQSGRPTHKTGFLGWFGPRVDSIHCYTQQLKTATIELQAEQTYAILCLRMPSAVITFRSRTTATLAAQAVHTSDGYAWRVQLAPEPRDVYWRRLRKREWELGLRRAVVGTAMFFIVVFFMVPVVFIAGFTNPETLKGQSQQWRNLLTLPVVGTVLRAIFATWVLLLFLKLVPIFALWVSKIQLGISLSQLQRQAFSKFFYILLFNVFIGYTLSGTLFSQLQYIIDHPAELVTILGASIPTASSFFITFVVTRSFSFMPLELIQYTPLLLHPLISLRYVFQRPVPGVPSHPQPEAVHIDYHRHTPNHLNILVLGLNFCIIAPLMLPFVLGYFALGYLIWRNQIMHAHVTKFESGGRMWPVIHNRIIAALLVMQITIIGIFALKLSIRQTPFLLPLPVMTIAFYYITRRRFLDASTYLSVDRARKADLREWARREEDMYWLDDAIAAYVPDCMKNSLYDVPVQQVGSPSLHYSTGLSRYKSDDYGDSEPADEEKGRPHSVYASYESSVQWDTSPDIKGSLARNGSGRHWPLARSKRKRGQVWSSNPSSLDANAFQPSMSTDSAFNASPSPRQSHRTRWQSNTQVPEDYPSPSQSLEQSSTQVPDDRQQQQQGESAERVTKRQNSIDSVTSLHKSVDVAALRAAAAAVREGRQSLDKLR